MRLANSTTLLMLGVISTAKFSNIEHRQATVWSSTGSACTRSNWWFGSCHKHNRRHYYYQSRFKWHHQQQLWGTLQNTRMLYSLQVATIVHQLGQQQISDGTLNTANATVTDSTSHNCATFSLSRLTNLPSVICWNDTKSCYYKQKMTVQYVRMLDANFGELIS